MKRKSIFTIGGIILLFLGLIYGISTNNVSLYAQVVDNVLRPTFGNKNTIALESWYFGLRDQIYRMGYYVKKPDSNIFTSNLVNTSSIKKVSATSSINLDSIPVPNNFPHLDLEGVWQAVPQALFPNQVVMAKTFLRPDPIRDYAIVSILKMDMRKLSIGIEAGTYYPGGTRGVFGPGFVPKVIQQSNLLVAVFNGGFMEKDGHYGMAIGNKTYVPLRKGLATFLVHSDGKAQIIDYQGQLFDSSVIGIRQNGTFLIKNGTITSFVENGIDTWGRTTTNSMYTWRSGIGITAEGNIVYAVGNSLVPQTLAKALQEAGAVDAMQLDINPYWVRFILYNPLGNGTYSYYSLLKDMYNGGYAYLHGYNKDFFYVYKKS